jgi:hypothetical protein
MFTTTTIRKELKTIPFDKATEVYKDAADMALDTQQSALDYAHKQNCSNLEKLYSDSSETPYEGNFADSVPKPQISQQKKLEIRRKAGNRALVEIFVPRYHLDKCWTWMMPQVISHLAKLTPRIVPTTTGTVEGQICGLEYVKKYFFNGDAWSEGLYRFLMLDSRSSYLQQQYKGEGRNYCALIPLIMYAHKLHNNIPYAAWGRENLRYVVNDSLAQAMLCDVPLVSNEELIQIRESGLTVRTGAKAGEQRNPVTTYKLYGIQDSEIGIWCAHPENRTKYMVLDPKVWDRVPAPLIAQSVFKMPQQHVEIVTSSQAETMPWDL